MMVTIAAILGASNMSQSPCWAGIRGLQSCTPLQEAVFRPHCMDDKMKAQMGRPHI